MPKSRNDWKACIRQKRIPSSNLGHSANNRLVSDFLPSNDKSIIQSKKVALRGKKTAKQAHPMRKVRVSLYFGRSFDRNDTAPVMICVNHASSSCYIPIPGVRIKRSQWDKVRKIMPDRRKVDEANKNVLDLFL